MAANTVEYNACLDDLVRGWVEDFVCSVAA